VTEPLHIMSFASGLAGGGVERALLRLTQGWLDAGARVTLAIADPSGPLAAELPAGASLVRTRLAAAVRAARPDILFCPGNAYTSRAALLRLQLGRRCPPIVLKISNVLDRADLPWPLRTGNRWWVRAQPLFFDRLVAMTPGLARETAHATGLSAARIAVIANPPARPVAGAPPIPLPAGRFIVGVGRLAPQKRWDRLIAALPLLSDPQVPAVIVGEGQERASLLAQATQLGIAHRLFLPGHAADPHLALAAAAVAVLPSDYEGVPGVLREALSVGTPVVTTRSSRAIDEIVTSAALGSVVAGDPEAIAAAIDHWLAPGAVRPTPVEPPGANAAAA
jgi:glycosyltransferase involved in cell wall biosynthesis